MNPTSSLFCYYLGKIIVNPTDVLLLTVDVNVDFVIEQMKCHKDDKHEVKGLDTEVSGHIYILLNYLYPKFSICIPHGNIAFVRVL